MKFKEYKLNELYIMDSGISTKKEQAGHGYPFVSFRDIYKNAILPDNLTEKMDTTEIEQERYSVKKGDILITRTSETLDELAMSSVAIKDYPTATFSGFAKRLRPIKQGITYDKFMAFYLRSNYFRKIVNCKAVMTLRASFNEEIFSYIKILLPDYEFQKKSGDLLYAIECQIINNNKINEKLENISKTIFDYWFLQYEFPNKDGKPYKSSGGNMVWCDELKKDIPKGWKVYEAKELFDFIKGKNPEELVEKRDVVNSIKYLNIEALSENKKTFCNKSNMIIAEGEVLMVMDGASSCDVFLGAEGAIGSTLSKLKIKNDIISNNFLYIMMDKYKNIFKRANIGSAIPHANKKYISDFKIALPTNNNLQKTIMELMDRVNSNKLENEKLLDLKEYLLPLLMNGQIGFKKTDK